MYTIRIHPLKSAEDQEPTIENHCLSDEMLIKDLKSLILTLTDARFYLKFHMGNEERLKDLIIKTKEWNTARGISNETEALAFDVYLDQHTFDLHLELDAEED